MISSPAIHGWMTGGTGHSIAPDAKQKPHPPSHHSSGAAHRGGRPLRGCTSLVTKRGSQGMEFEHFSPNDSLQAARKRHRGAGNRACGSAWLRAERRAGILFRAVCLQCSRFNQGGLRSRQLLPLNYQGRQGSAVPCFIMVQDVMSSQGLMPSHEANKEEKVCLLGSSAGVAPVALYSKSAKINIPLYR